MGRQMHQVGRVRLLGRGVIIMIPIDADDMVGIVDVWHRVVPGRERKHPEQCQNRRQRKKPHVGERLHGRAQHDRRCRHVVRSIANTVGPQVRHLLSIMSVETKVIGVANADEDRR